MLGFIEGVSLGCIEVDGLPVGGIDDSLGLSEGLLVGDAEFVIVGSLVKIVGRSEGGTLGLLVGFTSFVGVPEGA